MDLKGILSISGYAGLYKLVSQAKNSIIVESLIDKSRMPAYASSKISALEDIAIYTSDEEISLKEVFKAMYTQENGGEAISHKASNDELKKYFSVVLPNFDKERVYVSDIKKIINWYNTLISLNLLSLEESPVDEKEVEQVSNN